MENHAWYLRVTANRAFKSTNYTHEKPVLAIIFRVPTPSVNLYLNPRFVP